MEARLATAQCSEAPQVPQLSRIGRFAAVHSEHSHSCAAHFSFASPHMSHSSISDTFIVSQLTHAHASLFVASASASFSLDARATASHSTLIWARTILRSPSASAAPLAEMVADWSITVLCTDTNDCSTVPRDRPPSESDPSSRESERPNVSCSTIPVSSRAVLWLNTSPAVFHASCLLAMVAAMVAAAVG